MKQRLDDRVRRAVGPEAKRQIERFTKWLANVEVVLTVGLIYLGVAHHRALAVGWACAMAGGGALVTSLYLDRILKKPYDLRYAVQSMLLTAVLFGAVAALFLYYV